MSLTSMFTTFPSRFYRQMQKWAHENPAIYWSLIIGGAGPVMVAVAMPYKRRFGSVTGAELPTSYPRSPRNKELSGYDDPE